jgi:hypothetical protein
MGFGLQTHNLDNTLILALICDIFPDLVAPQASIEGMLNNEGTVHQS